jgi:hypothetical protein
VVQPEVNLGTHQQMKLPALKGSARVPAPPLMARAVQHHCCEPAARILLSAVSMPRVSSAEHGPEVALPNPTRLPWTAAVGDLPESQR